jgi:hypothetical protein
MATVHHLHAALPMASVAAALVLAKALEGKLEGALQTEAAALSAMLAVLDGANAPAGMVPSAAEQPATELGAELGGAMATSCIVPRGKFDLQLRDGAPHTLCGTAVAQRWRLGMDDVVQLATVPKGDSVKPMMLVVAQLRKPLPTYKADGSLKSKGSPYVVLQFPGKELSNTVRDFVAQMTSSATPEMCAPSPSVFRSMCARPNQPDCALKVRLSCSRCATAAGSRSPRACPCRRSPTHSTLKPAPHLQCFRDVSDGFLYLVKNCIVFVPSSGSGILALCTRWIGSVSFARSPTGRSFSMTVEVDSERVGSETVGDAASPTFDEAYTFNEMDVTDENLVNEYAPPVLATAGPMLLLGIRAGRMLD